MYDNEEQNNDNKQPGVMLKDQKLRIRKIRTKVQNRNIIYVFLFLMMEMIYLFVTFKSIEIY